MSTYTPNIEGIKTASEGTMTSIHRSGIFEISINQAYIKTLKNGAKKLFLNYKLKGSNKNGGTLFVGMTNKDGSDNFQKPLFDKLIVVLGLKEVKFSKQPVTTKAGTTEESCIPALANQEVKVWVRASYSKWNNQITESIDVQEFFRVSDNASAKEVITKENIGQRYKACESKFGVSYYKDGLTEAQIKDWKKAQVEARQNGTTYKPQVDVVADDEIPF